MAEQPTCTRCGLPHWRFLPCEQTEEEKAEEVAAVAAEKELYRRTAVIPQARTRLPPPRFQGKQFTMQAPGVYRRVRGQ